MREHSSERSSGAGRSSLCPALLAVLDESFVLVDHLRFITRSRTALDRKRVSHTAAQAKRKLSEHKLSSIARARQGSSQISKAVGLTERLAERLSDYRDVELGFMELLRLEGEATQACVSAEGELEAAYTELAEEKRRFREVTSAAGLRAERAIASATAAHAAARCEAERHKQSDAAKFQLCMERVLGLQHSRHGWNSAARNSAARS
mmetsp:Transcript_15790/g.31918  ORF Transcript_15790/g.31918 Transcript_15790/m.31918 type:complete len:207 (+) Transcript_15790:24-644(+)